MVHDRLRQNTFDFRQQDFRSLGRRVLDIKVARDRLHAAVTTTNTFTTTFLGRILVRTPPH